MNRLKQRLSVWFLILFSTGVLSAQSLKIAPDLQSLISNALAPVDVVIQYNAAPGLLDITKIVSLGGVVKTQYTLIPGVAVRLPAAVVAMLALDPGIAYISVDRVLAGSGLCGCSG